MIDKKYNTITDNNLTAFPRHTQHAGAVGEVHSRPIPLFSSNRVILHYAFMADRAGTDSLSVLSELCRTRGESVPTKDMRYHEISWDKGMLRWEKHSEFSTFTYDTTAPRSFLGNIPNHPFGAGFTAPGKMISGCRIEIRKLTPASLKLLQSFDQDSLCVSKIDSSKSLIATDFHQDTNGMTVFLLLEAGMPENRIGFFAKSAIEIDTYRTLAMLGLPLARSLSGQLRKFEVELSRLTSAMRNAKAGESEALLDEISALAADLEADAASSLFRFGASRAYGNIVKERIEAAGARALSGYMSIGAFLERSLLPALSTCVSVENRQEELSRKISRAANLLRTRVEIEIENQNRNLLDSMNRRTKMQYRLQQTVEGLSIAAVSYYVVGLFYYFIQAFGENLVPGLSAKVATGMFVPVAIFLIWMFVRYMRRKYSE